MASFRRNIFFVLCEVADHFIDAVHTDRREVITQRAEITSCIREQALIHMALNDLALNLQAVAGQVKQIVQTIEQTFFVLSKNITQTSAVDCHNA